MKLDSITSALSEKGLKATQQRIVVYRAVLESKDHPTAELVYESIKKNNPTISLATVYKTLETLAESRLINKVSTPQGSMRYDGVTERHNHIYISNTNEILDFEDSELREILQQYLNKKNFYNLNITDVKLQIKGEKIDPGKGISIK